MKTKHKKIEPGDVFQANNGGSVTVIEYKSCDEVLARWNDEHGHVSTVSSRNIRKGAIGNPYYRSARGVGYLGVGRHPATKGRDLTPAYQSWNGMIGRCYDERFILRHPTYADCTVHPDWHNFQVFAEWFYSQPHSETAGFEIDKDLLVLGNKIYSAETCSFVPGVINRLLVDCGASRGEWPQGVSLNKRVGRFVAELRIEGKSKQLGYYQCAAEAHKAYLNAKKAHVQAVAERFKSVLHRKVYDNLINWSL